MTGVNIITSYEAVTEYAFNWMTFLMYIIATIVIATIFVIYNYKKNNYSVNDLFLAYVVFIILGCCYGSILGVNTHKPIKYETRHMAFISDDVLLVEFMENYEIIEKQGKIYILREIK